MSNFKIHGLKIRIPDPLINDLIKATFESGHYERAERRAMQKNLTPQDRVLELGAGAGYLAIIMALIVGAENVLTIEANAKMIPVIQGNLARNDAGGVAVVHAAVVADDFDAPLVSFYTSPGFWSASLTEKPTAQVTHVPARTFTSLLEQHRPSVVMMDIEGGEEDLFETPWPSYVRLLVIELHPRKYSAHVVRHIFDQMSASGFAYDPSSSTGDVVTFKRLPDE